jgi:hypothetical protein
MGLRLSILPFKGVDAKSLDNMVEDLSTLNIQASVLPSAKISKAAFSRQRKQFHGQAFLEAARSRWDERANGPAKKIDRIEKIIRALSQL